MKRIALFVTLLCVSASLFAFDGSYGYSQKKDDFSIGTGYTSYYIYENGQSENGIKLKGQTISFKTETSLPNNRDTSVFWQTNFLIPSLSDVTFTAFPSISLNLKDLLATSDYDSILIFDSSLGVNSTSYLDNLTSIYYGVGAHMFLTNYNQSSSGFSDYTGSLGLGAVANFGIQYKLSSSLIFDFGGSGVYDFFIYSYDEDDIELTDNYGIGWIGKIALTFRSN
jgi:hypothetical protein